MKDKVCIVTGGNTGIGKAIAVELARLQAHVIITSRDANKGEAALADIRETVPDSQVQLVVGDLGTVASTRRLVETLLQQLGQIHVLINNAGMWMNKRVLNADGLEVSFMVNHLAPFMLSQLLLERLQASAPARIVNVNAGLYVKGKVDLDKTPYGHDFGRFATYANTKLCNVLFTCELARQIEGSGVTVNAVHPGVIRTKLGDMPGPIGLLLRFIKRNWELPETGAHPPVWLATTPELNGVNGKYFHLQTEMALTDTAQDEMLARQLWELSIHLGGLEV